MTLNELGIGKRATVVSISGGVLRRRLHEMGITVGAELVTVRTAPFRTPIEIRIRGYDLAISRADAGMIEVIELR